VYVGGGGKMTQIVTAYQPCDTKKQPTMGEMVWDQHTRYFEAQGGIQDFWTMFKLDLLSLLCRRKTWSDEIILMGNFNKNVNTGPLAASFITSAKQDDNYGASNIILPCPGS
jgi:hypothetical protein